MKKSLDVRMVREAPDQTQNFLKTVFRVKRTMAAAGTSARKMSFIFVATSSGEVAVRGKREECVWAQPAPAQFV